MKSLVFMIILTLILGCSKIDQVEQEISAPQSMVDDFIIMAYSGPPLEEVNIERYQEIADAGIEYLVPGNGTFNSEQNLKAMEIGEKVGIKIVPLDMRLVPFALTPGITIDTSVVKSVVNDYKDHPAFAGYVVKDEPHANVFPALYEISNLIRKEDLHHEPLINLFPSYGTLTQLGFEDFRGYINSYLDIVKPKLLSYDYYPFRLNNQTMVDGWFSDLLVVRDETRKANIPFMVFMQSEGITEGLRIPNRAEILWQVNTALAYGARGVGWFSYWTPVPDQGFPQEEGAAPPIVEHHHNAMIGLNGNRTEVYDYVKEANLYLKKTGKGLLGWDNINVARYEDGQLIEGSSPVLSPKGEGENIVIGTYLLDKKARVVISNSSCEESTAVALDVQSGWEPENIFASIDAEQTSKLLLEWSIKPGGSVIIELK
ncbi:MAG: hypothetical protein ABFS12_13395 [Bacteroidota bacterium]